MKIVGIVHSKEKKWSADGTDKGEEWLLFDPNVASFISLAANGETFKNGDKLEFEARIVFAKGRSVIVEPVGDIKKVTGNG